MRLASPVLLAALLAAPAAASAGEVGFTPYIWIPGIDGTLGAGTSGDSGSAGFSNVSDFKIGGAMLNLGWQEGRFVVFGDWTYANVRAEAPSPDGLLFTTVQGQIKGNIAQLFSGYMLLDRDGLRLDAFLGARAYGLTGRLSFTGGPATDRLLEANQIWVDAVTGLRFDARFAGKWFGHLRADVGTGGSSLTWQAYAAGGYGFSWGDLLLGYRHLYIDKGEGNLRLRLALSGPLVGAHFAF